MEPPSLGEEKRSTSRDPLEPGTAWHRLRSDVCHRTWWDISEGAGLEDRMWSSMLADTIRIKSWDAPGIRVLSGRKKTMRTPKLRMQEG
jgi:hypothetical protein